MPSRINRAAVCLRIAEVLYIILAVSMGLLALGGLLFAETQEEKIVSIIMFVIVTLIGGGLAVFIHMVIRDLRQKKYWAWVASICLFALFTPSALFPLGIIGLFSVLGADTRKEFGMK